MAKLLMVTRATVVPWEQKEEELKGAVSVALTLIEAEVKRWKAEIRRARSFVREVPAKRPANAATKRKGAIG
ncbi:MAG TPA: hypothetical protein VHI13_16250 [Candidatus Kapabacteria bacterium]|nr:hypothetical protein [Candidatus Kapabacteria bacterium]